MPRKKKTDTTRLKREVLGILMATTGAFLLVGLWPWDPVAARTPVTVNRVGVLGSYAAFYLYRALGFGALVGGLALVLGGALVFLHRASRKTRALGLSALAATWVLLALCGVAGVWIAGPSPWAARGGALGTVTASGLVQIVGLVGALLFCLVALVVLAVATFQVSLAAGVEAGVEAGRAGGRRARAGLGWVGDRVGRGEDRASLRTPEGATEPPPQAPSRVPASLDAEAPAGGPPAREAAAPPARGRRRAGPADSWLPPLSLLATGAAPDTGQSAEDLEALGRVLIEKLRSFHVEGEVVAIHSGPVLTQYEVKPAPGVKVNQIANLADDLALAMRAQRIRIVAPIPGKGAVGIEVPNPRARVVTMREVLESPAWGGFGGKLPLALGHEIAGAPVVTDLTRMPHLLIAGATGSGKSVCINAIVTSLLYRYGPDAVRFIMIDPKMLELVVYNGIPHLLHPVVVEHKESAKALKWTVAEMERRYRLLAANGIRSVADFNARVKAGDELAGAAEAGETLRPLPYIVVLIDELADLMLTVQQEIEEPLARLAQMARAVGIHLVLATQRPSVNVITGVIKANFPSRLSFQVSSKIDSRTVLDMNGAEQLLGNGDMLFLPADRAEPIRIQGAFLSSEETSRVVAWLREAGERLNAEEVAPPVDIIAEASELEFAALDERDELFFTAARVVVDHDQGSTSLLQRRLRVGYSRAARILDQLEQAGIVGPPDGTKPREVRITDADLELLEADHFRS
ncbi:MAG TPA: DNA translocase FtsK 4TM domain-containing protein [Gemmatimonadota bacterium]|nr:DNA translocase FtsK 4TM domain-containing protein [Gemmatimonadota bacterium]